LSQTYFGTAPPTGLDLERFDEATPAGLREPLEIPGTAPLMVVVSNFIHYKGHATFLTAWARVVVTPSHI